MFIWSCWGSAKSFSSTKKHERLTLSFNLSLWTFLLCSCLWLKAVWPLCLLFPDFLIFQSSSSSSILFLFQVVRQSSVPVQQFLFLILHEVRIHAAFELPSISSLVLFDCHVRPLRAVLFEFDLEVITPPEIMPLFSSWRLQNMGWFRLNLQLVRRYCFPFDLLRRTHKLTHMMRWVKLMKIFKHHSNEWTRTHGFKLKSQFNERARSQGKRDTCEISKLKIEWAIVLRKSFWLS